MYSCSQYSTETLGFDTLKIFDLELKVSYITVGVGLILPTCTGCFPNSTSLFHPPALHPPPPPTPVLLQPPHYYMYMYTG